MKLYETPTDSWVKIVSIPANAPFTKSTQEGEVLYFYHVDGMYSLCKTEHGVYVHPSASTEIELVPQPLDKK